MEQQKIGTCVIVLDEGKKNVLLGKRLNSYKAGMLGLPGGRVEAKEPLDECGKREVLEETSIEINNLTYVGVIRELQGESSFIHFAFFSSDHTGNPQLLEPEKCESWEWYPLDALPENIVPGHRAALDMFLNSDKPLYRDLLL